VKPYVNVRFLPSKNELHELACPYPKGKKKPRSSGVENSQATVPEKSSLLLLNVIFTVFTVSHIKPLGDKYQVF